MVDVTVYGAGIFGLSIAWSCVKQGATVQLIDPYGAGAGSSGGLVGALAPHVPENWNDKKQFQFESLIMAEAFWAEVSQTGGADSGYARLGRLQPIADAHGLSLAQQRVETAAELWGHHAEWHVRPAEAYGEWAPKTPSGWLIHDTLSARMHPRQACAALVAALAAKGAKLETEGDPEGRIVWATGVTDLNNISENRPRTFGNGVKGQAALLLLDQRTAPQLFSEGIHIVPHSDGTVAVGSTSERDYTNPTATDTQLDTVLERAYSAVPALEDAEIIERWAGVRPRTRSRAPVLGEHPLYRGAFIANGGFKIGFGMAPKVGAVMANLLLHGRDNIPPSFKPEANY